MDEMERLLRKLHGMSLFPDENDGWVWSLNNKGSFSTKSFLGLSKANVILVLTGYPSKVGFFPLDRLSG